MKDKRLLLIREAMILYYLTEISWHTEKTFRPIWDGKCFVLKPFWNIFPHAVAHLVATWKPNAQKVKNLI